MKLTCLERYRYLSDEGCDCCVIPLPLPTCMVDCMLITETIEARLCPDKSPAPRSVHFSAEWAIVSWKPRLLICQLCAGRYSPFRAPKIEETLENCSIAEEIVRTRPRIVLRDSKSMV